jgi:dolichol-phosphate mannosyltransferase
MDLTRSVELSLVIPCYNESEVLPLLKERLLSCLNRLTPNWEVLFVNDGSRDSTLEMLAAMHRENPRFKVIAFSRNFGHQAAISAGLAYASGAAVGVMDADLQDPPEIFGECLQKLTEGYDVVYAVRRKRKESLPKRMAYAAFYRLFRFLAESEMPLDSGDFCLMSRRVVNQLKNMPERNVLMRGLRAWVGFRQIGLEYDRDARAAGSTKYSLWKLIRLARDGIFAFSTVPLRLATHLGFYAVGFSILAAVFVVAWRVIGFRLLGHSAGDVPGWAGIVVAVLFLNGIQFLILGFIGEYVGRIYSEVKHRPRWVVAETFGVAAENSRQTD